MSDEANEAFKERMSKARAAKKEGLPPKLAVSLSFCFTRLCLGKAYRSHVGEEAWASRRNPS